MRFSLLLMAVILAGVVQEVGARPMAVAESQRVRSDQENLIQLEQEWDRAFHRRDVAFIENVLADEFMATYGDGSRGDRAKELALAVAFNQPIVSSTLDEFTVKVYGDTAVVWFRQQLILPIQGGTVAVNSRYVDVFVFRAGRWQCVASQSTRVTPPA